MRIRILASAVIIGLVNTATTNAAMIIPNSSIPLSNPASVFDYSHSGNSYSSGTEFNGFGSYDIRDLFGGQFGTTEPGDVIFPDDQPIGTVDTVLVTLASPVSITSFDFWCTEDTNGTGHRSMREFKLFAGSTLLDDVQILNTSGNQTYTNVYGGPDIEVSDTLSGAPIAASYTLEFIQNQAANGTSGLRANEFEAFVPEPATFSIMAVAAFGLLARRRRVVRKPLYRFA